MSNKFYKNNSHSMEIIMNLNRHSSCTEFSCSMYLMYQGFKRHVCIVTYFNILMYCHVFLYTYIF